MKITLPCLIRLGAAILPPALGAAASPPADIGRHLQLFVDDAMVEQCRHVALQLHPPSPAEVSLKFDQPWEGPSNHYPLVLKDDDRYRMYYHSAPVAADHKGQNPSHSFTAYAESPDGIHWTRPDLGLFEFNGSRHNNIVWPNFGSDVGTILVPVRNTRPGAPADMRYLSAGVHKRYIGTEHGAQLHIYKSADAIHWSRLSDRPIFDHAKSTTYPSPNLLDSTERLFWDERSGRYFLYLRDEWVAPGTGELMRGLRFSTSPDLEHWTYPEWIQLRPNPPDQFYTALPAPYFREPTLYLCFPMRYLAHRNAELPQGYEAYRDVGATNAVFMSSRDGLHWDRTFLESWLRPGLDPLRWTDRSNSPSPGPIPTGPAEMSVYVVEYFHLPLSQIRRFSMRTDGVSSIHAGFHEGSFVTKPILFAGKRLLINASTSAAGGVRVEVLAADGTPIDRYCGENALEFFGDSVAHEVRWDQGPDISALAGTAIRLRFLMKDADLYSYRFQD